MLKKEFFKNVLPAMLAFAFSGIYAIVDGWFVGQNIGDTGLAAINIAYPIAALIQAAGSGIGMGGAIQLGICIGEKDEKGQREFMGGTLLLLLAACLVLTGVLSFCGAPLLRLFGAEGEILRLGQEYIQIISWGASCQILSTGLIPLIRNYDGAFLAMAAMVGGCITNVLFDWLFVSVWQYGIAGAAAATLLGQAVTLIPCMAFLLVRKKLQTAVYRPNRLAEIGAVALSPFGLTLSPHIALVILNKGALVYGGETAAACYAVISYVICVAQLLLQGIGDGAQPLVSRFFGLREKTSIRTIRRYSYLFSFGVALLCALAMFLLRNRIPPFFGTSEEVGRMIASTLPTFLAGLGFAAFLRVTTSYFYAIRQNRLAYLLIYGEPLLLLAGVLLLPFIWDLDGVWIAVPAAQGVLTLLGGFLLKKSTPI